MVGVRLARKLAHRREAATLRSIQAQTEYRVVVSIRDSVDRAAMHWLMAVRPTRVPHLDVE